MSTSVCGYVSLKKLWESTHIRLSAPSLASRSQPQEATSTWSGPVTMTLSSTLWARPCRKSAHSRQWSVVRSSSRSKRSSPRTGRTTTLIKSSVLPTESLTPTSTRKTLRSQRWVKSLLASPTSVSRRSKHNGSQVVACFGMSLVTSRRIRQSRSLTRLSA